MKQLTLSFLLSLLPMMASADVVEINGIWYNLVPKAKEAEVTKNPSISNYYGSYSGDIEIPNTVLYENKSYDVTSINSYAFSYCRELTSVLIPNSVTSIGDYAFQHCEKLPIVSIPSNVTTIGTWAFYGCESLTSVYIYDIESWLKISFGDNPFPVAHHLYLNGDEITDLNIPNNVTSIGKGTFNGCIGLTTVSIPNNVINIGEGAFYGCSSLLSVNIPNSVTSIDMNAFRDCAGLTSISFPNSLISIGWNAFSGCSNLISLNIPNSVKSIGRCSFYGCTNLTSVTLGKGLKSIGELAFQGCSELTDVYCSAENITTSSGSGNGFYTNTNAFQDSYPQYITLHVPASAINAYKTTAPWSDFKEFVPISEEQIKKCATPTISIENGKVKLKCETEGVEFVSSISAPDAKNYYDSELTLSYKYKVSVYATKNGYENSDTSTLEITASGIVGDVDGNGVVNVADHVELTKIIMNQ